MRIGTTTAGIGEPVEGGNNIDDHPRPVPFLTACLPRVLARTAGERLTPKRAQAIADDAVPDRFSGGP